MRIVVTQRDIESGVPGSAKACPGARALRRHLRCRVSVGPAGIVLESGFKAPLPPQVEDRITQYDNGWGMSPFWFTLPAYAYSTTHVCGRLEP